MINVEKSKKGKCQPPPSTPILRRPAPTPYYHPLFKLFHIRPSGGGNQGLLPSPTFKKEGSKLWLSLNDFY